MIFRSAVRARARADAVRGIYQPDEYIIATQGPQPGFDPLANLEHAAIGNRLQEPLIEETEQDVRREEDEITRHPNWLLLLVFLGLLLVVEESGGIYVMRTIGIPAPERIIFGSALAVGLFFTAWLISRAANHLRSAAALVVFAILVAALTVIRVDDNAIEGGAVAVDWASAAIMVAVTVGPALMAEHLLRLLSPVLPIIRRIWRLRRRLTHLTKSRSGANRFVVNAARERSRWEREAATRRALYDVAFRSARADLAERAERVPAPPPPPPAPRPRSTRRNSSSLSSDQTN
jgi:hypothetical protein